MKKYDIAIIGTGPAGLSAAITAKIRNKKIILFGSDDLSVKVQKGHTIQNYLGLPAISGEDLGAAFRRHLDDMDIGITTEKVTAVYAMGDYFSLQTSANEMYEADAVILATGVITGKPFPGENELLGRGVSYCATCDAPLYRGKSAVVIGYSPKEESEADFLAEIADKVYYIPMYKEEPHLSESIDIIYDKPKEIQENDGKRELITAQSNYTVDGVFILRESVAPSQLVPGLKTEGGHVLVDRTMSTNIPGCFACGDVVGLPYQYIKSAGEGNIAALSAVNYIDQKRREKVAE